jgi:hypothetical protein
LLLNNTTGSATGTGAIVVNANGTLGGTGSTTGSVSVLNLGTLAPGASTESLAIGSLTMQSGSTFEVEVGGNTAGAAINGYDQLNVTGTVNLGGATLDVSTVSFTPTDYSSFFILTNDGVDLVSGTFAGLTNDSSFQMNGQNWKIRYNVDALTANLVIGSGNDIALIAQPPIPEPGMFGLMAIGGVLLVAKRRSQLRTRANSTV